MFLGEAVLGEMSLFDEAADQELPMVLEILHPYVVLLFCESKAIDAETDNSLSTRLVF